MKQVILVLGFLATGLLPYFTYAQETANGYFDPEHDPILVTTNQKVRFALSEDVMVRAVDIRFTHIGQIETIYKKQLYDNWYIFIEGREQDKIEQSVVITLKLKAESTGRYFADNAWTACVGDTCGNCGFNETQLHGCFCLGEDPVDIPGNPGFCYSIWSDEPLFKKTLLKLE